MILADTPGIFAPRRRLDRAMVAAAWEGAHRADAILLVVDAVKQRRHELTPILEALKDRKERKLLALNKVDASPKEPLLKLARSGGRRVRRGCFHLAMTARVASSKARLCRVVPRAMALPRTGSDPRKLRAPDHREQIYRHFTKVPTRHGPPGARRGKDARWSPQRSSMRGRQKPIVAAARAGSRRSARRGPLSGYWE